MGFRAPQAPLVDTARAVEPESPRTSPGSPEPAASIETTIEPTPETLTAVGEAVRIRWGTVQVAVTTSDGRIVAVETLRIPLGDRRSASLNKRAEPILREEALASSSAYIDVVSGATYTSMAYAQSLQSALDQLAG